MQATQNAPIALVITTIANDEHPVLRRIAQFAREKDWSMLIVGDAKSPEGFEIAGVEYYSLERQFSTGFKIASKMPQNHYARKNLGYVLAMAAGAAKIIDTDDDNLPIRGFGESHVDDGALSMTEEGWWNVYEHFYDGHIWPRGFPLDEILAHSHHAAVQASEGERRAVALEQGMVSGEPDVDAIFRLTRRDRPEPRHRESVIVGQNVWVPFNSQNTLWHPEAYPFLYLPATCSFRMTDIWRSFIAQQGLWNMGKRVLFHGPTLQQVRNEHNYMQDFIEEQAGYVHNKRLVAWLSRAAEETSSPIDYLRRAYEVLIEDSFFEPAERDLLDCWIADLHEASQ